MVPQVFGNLTDIEVKKFKNQYSMLMDGLSRDLSQENFPCAHWVKKVLNYNVPHGKLLRGLFVPMTVKCFEKEPTNEMMEQAFVLGWCIEMLQAFFLVADDIMDRNETRRGRHCWYKVDDIGALAVNDSFLIEHTIYRILAKRFRNHPRYADLLDIFLEMTYKTVLGQCLDTEIERSANNRDYYSMERYKKIVHYKTSFYTIYLPMAVAITLLGLSNKVGFLKKLEEVAMDVGYLFQIQDDYLDCYGNESITGKIGTDIENGKCSWLYVTALELASPTQQSSLQLIYGKTDNICVTKIKAIYNELDLPTVYIETVAAQRFEISKKLEDIGCEPVIKAVFFMLEIFHNRQK